MKIVRIGNSEVSVKEYRGQRVVTFKEIDNVHQRPEGTARVTFNRHKDKFKESQDYFVCDTYEAQSLGIRSESDYSPNILHFILIEMVLIVNNFS